MRLFQNGLGVDSLVYSNTLSIPSNLIYGKKRDNSEYYDGHLDDIRIWDQAVSLADIVKNKDRALVGDEAGLVGYWKFDENQAIYSFDMTVPKCN